VSRLLVSRTPIGFRLGRMDEDGEVVRLHHELTERREPRLGDLVRAKIGRRDERLGGVFCDLGEGGQGFLPVKGKPPTEGSTLLCEVRREAIGEKACGLSANPSLRLPGVTLRLEDGSATPGPVPVADEAAEAAARRLTEELERDGALGVVSAAPALVRALTGMLSREVEAVFCDDADDAALLKGWLSPLGVEVALQDPRRVRAPLDEAEEGALARTAPLPGGGRLTFDEAEALVAIDVDVGRTAGRSAKGAGSRAADALFPVLERQAALRSFGGQVVLDLPRAAIQSPKIVRDRLSRALSHFGRPSVPAVTGEGVCVAIAPRPVPSLLERLTEPFGGGVRPGRRLRADVLADRAFRLAEAALLADRTARVTLDCPERAASYLRAAEAALTDRYGARLTVETHEGDDVHVR
jgi:Ribonuclease G/E